MANKQKILTQLRRDMSRSAQRSFDSCRQENPGEDFYAFALSSDSGCQSGPSPAASSEQSFERAVQKNVSRVYSPSEIGILRYCPDEWAYGGAGSTDGWFEIWDMQEKHKLSGQKMLTTMILALKDLDSTGYFGVGLEREKITLLVWMSDSYDAKQHCSDWVRELNPPNVYKRFEAEWPLPN